MIGPAATNSPKSRNRQQPNSRQPAQNAAHHRAASRARGRTLGRLGVPFQRQILGARIVREQDRNVRAAKASQLQPVDRVFRVQLADINAKNCFIFCRHDRLLLLAWLRVPCQSTDDHAFLTRTRFPAHFLIRLILSKRMAARA